MEAVNKLRRYFFLPFYKVIWWWQKRWDAYMSKRRSNLSVRKMMDQVAAQALELDRLGRAELRERAKGILMALEWTLSKKGTLDVN